MGLRDDIIGARTGREKSAIRARACYDVAMTGARKLVLPYRFQRPVGPRIVTAQIDKIEIEPSGVLAVMGRAFDGADEIRLRHRRWRWPNPPTAVKDPAGSITRTRWDEERLQEVVTKRYREDPLAALLEVIGDELARLALTPAGPGEKVLEETTNTFFAETSDGGISSFDQAASPSYTDARAGTGSGAPSATDFGNFIELGQRYDDKLGDPFYEVYESFVQFDTTSLPDGDTIDSAEFSFEANNDNSDTDFTVELYDEDWGASLTAADWVPGADLSGMTLRASYDTSSGWTGGTRYTFTDVALAAAVSKTANTRLMLASSRMRTGTAPTGKEFVSHDAAEVSGTTSDERLIVEHSAGSSIGPKAYHHRHHNLAG